MSEKILATNQVANAAGLQEMDSRGVLPRTQREDGRWVYTRNPNQAEDADYGVWVKPATNSVSVGDVVVVIIELVGDVTRDDPVNVEYADPLLSIKLSDTTWLVAASAKYASTRFPIQILSGEAAVVLNAGIFTAEDWPTVLERYADSRLKLPYFDGDTHPKKHN